MPLIIAVVVLLFIFIKLYEDKKAGDKTKAMRTKDRAKTNATLERNLVDSYMKHGYSFDDAFRKSYEDMVAAGYEPCIPKNAYSKNSNGIQSSYCHNPRDYDSFWVKQRRSAIVQEWVRIHPGERIPYEELDAQIYADYPRTESQYLHDLKVQSSKSQAIPVGEYLIYPELGTCEVLSHNYFGNGVSGTYTLKVLSTGKIVSFVKIGDQKIRRQGKQ